MVEELLDVVVSDSPDFDAVYFGCWVEGKRVDDTVISKINAVRNVAGSTAVNLDMSSAIQSGIYDLLKAEVMDYFRSYEILEKYLKRPVHISTHLSIPIPPHVVGWILEKYYSFDDRVVREILVKRFSKNRKDLDDISDQCNVSLVSVTRQYENLKRMYAYVEDSKQFQCNILSHIEANFSLPVVLARKYSCLLFLMAGRFSAISKKRFQNISCVHLQICAAVTMACLIPDAVTFGIHWSCAMDVKNVDPPPYVFMVEDVPAGPPHFTYASSTSVTIPSWSRDQSAESAIQNFHTMHPLPPPHIGSPIRTASGARSTASPNELTAGSVNSILNLHTTDGEVLTPPLTDFPSRHSSVSPPGPGLQQGCSSTSVDSLLDTSQGVAGGDRLHVGSGGQSGGETLRSHLMESAMGGGDNGGALGPDSPWPGIWRLVSVVDSLEPDKQLLSSLRDLMGLIKGEVMERAVVTVRLAVLSHASGGGDVIVRKLDSQGGRIKLILKSLLIIGGHLSQSSEYRDIYEDIVLKIGEPLEEARLSREEWNIFLMHCGAIVSVDLISRRGSSGDIFSSESQERKFNRLERDWKRFVTCCRFCLWNLY